MRRVDRMYWFAAVFAALAAVSLVTGSSRDDDWVMPTLYLAIALAFALVAYLDLTPSSRTLVAVAMGGFIAILGAVASDPVFAVGGVVLAAAMLGLWLVARRRESKVMS